MMRMREEECVGRAIRQRERRDGHRQIFVGGAAFVALIVSLGCIEGGPGAGGFSNVSGTVLGESFQMYGGVAESTGRGYAITITDSAGYDCFSTPSSRYLQVTWGSSGVGSTSASGNVTFSSVEGNLSPSDPATSGQVTIDAIDMDLGVISGSISAAGSDSQISGSFEVEICP